MLKRPLKQEPHEEFVFWVRRPSLSTTTSAFSMNGIDPQGYITDVITRIVQGHPNSRLDELLPWAYVAPIRAVA